MVLREGSRVVPFVVGAEPYCDDAITKKRPEDVTVDLESISIQHGGYRLADERKKKKVL